MGSNPKSDIMDAVMEYIYERHQFPSCTEIIDSIGITRSRCLQECQELVDEGDLHIVFEGKGQPKVYVPHYMMQGLLRTQKKPDWIEEYYFEKEPNLTNEIGRIQAKLIEYEIFRHLLYGTDIPLEESISRTLNYLEFDNVVHHKKNPDNPDIEFEYRGTTVLVESEGTKGAGTKKKVLQLEGWITRKIDEGLRTDEVQGIYALNHHREKKPDSRPNALSSHAKEFMKRYDFILITTPTLFTIVKDVVEGQSSKQDAREKVWKGDRIE